MELSSRLGYGIRLYDDSDLLLTPSRKCVSAKGAVVALIQALPWEPPCRDMELTGSTESSGGTPETGKVEPILLQRTGVGGLANQHGHREAFTMSILKASPLVEALQTYSAPLEGRRGLLRLDFNENTVGPSPLVVAAVRAMAPEHYGMYPEYDKLKHRYAQALGVAKEHVGLFNGADGAIHAVFQAFGAVGETLLMATPTFGYYAPCACQQGMTIRTVPYGLPGFHYPRQAVAQALQSRPRLLMICNPNNPTGTRMDPDWIRAMAAAHANTLVVVDELYEAFTGDTVLPLALQQPNLLVLRSLSKTAGLAALRLGFAVGSPGIVERLERVTGPYDVNGFAVTAAFAALDDPGHVRSYVQEVGAARDWLLPRLAAAGLRHHCDGGNYLLLWPDQDPDSLVAALRRRGVLVRPMTGKPLVDGSVRVSIGSCAQMKLFWERYQQCAAVV